MTAFMFATNHPALLQTLEALGDNACCYGGGDWVTRRCDCKYGRWTEKHNPLTSEQTGCPELRQIHRVLAHIPPDDWEQMMRRAGYAPHGRPVAGEDVAFPPHADQIHIATRRRPPMPEIDNLPAITTTTYHVTIETGTNFDADDLLGAIEGALSSDTSAYRIKVEVAD